MRTLFYSFFVFITITAKAQFSTKAVQVLGDIAVTRTILLDTLLKNQSVQLKDIPITNHRGELKYTIKEATGVSLKSLLNNVPLNAERSKDLSSYIFVCKAADGYSVVFSWNELFNTPVGEGVYVLYELDKKKIEGAQGGSFVLYSTADKFSGRRYVKWLSEIKIVKISGV